MSDLEILRAMERHAKDVISYCEPIGYEQLRNDAVLADACAFHLVEIGELAARVSPEFASDHPQIAWPELPGLIERAAPDCGKPDTELIWKVVREDGPELVRALEQILG